MKTYTFLCGGDYWESEVDVELTDDEAELVRKGSLENGEIMSAYEPTDEIYHKVCDAALEQCDDDPGSIMVRIPGELRKDLDWE